MDGAGIAYDVVVPAGGAATRLGGVDKPGVEVGGRPLLDHVLAAVGDAGAIVCVGPPRPTTRRVAWCREEPPGGGPAAALAAGAAVLAGCATPAPIVLVIGADLPGIAPAVPALLAALAADPGAGAAVLVDAAGRTNHLAAAWRRTELEAALDALGDPAGAAMGALIRSVRSIAVTDLGGWGHDCDTWDDVAAAAAHAADPMAATRVHRPT